MEETNMKDFDVKELEEDINNFSDDEKYLFDCLQVSRKFREGIYKKRKEMKFSERELANKADVKAFEVKAVEGGKSIAILSLVKILKSLELDINKIFE